MADTLSRGDKVFSHLHKAWVRFLKWDGDQAEVADANDPQMKPLPDYVHKSQLSTGR